MFVKNRIEEINTTPEERMVSYNNCNRNIKVRRGRGISGLYDIPEIIVVDSILQI